MFRFGRMIKGFSVILRDTTLWNGRGSVEWSGGGRTTHRGRRGGGRRLGVILVLFSPVVGCHWQSRKIEQKTIILSEPARFNLATWIGAASDFSPHFAPPVYISGRRGCCIIHRMIRLIRWSDGAFTPITLATNKRPCLFLLSFIYLEGKSKQMLGRPLSLIAVAIDAYIFHDLRSRPFVITNDSHQFHSDFQSSNKIV